MTDGRTKAKWRTVACPTCTAWIDEKCHILGDTQSRLPAPHLERVRLVDPENPRLRVRKTDEHGNRLIKNAGVIAKCIVQVGNGRDTAVWCFAEHDPGRPRFFGATGVGPYAVCACQRCGAAVFVEDDA